jgi:hypothetical protein
MEFPYLCVGSHSQGSVALILPLDLDLPPLKVLSNSFSDLLVHWLDSKFFRGIVS